MKCPKCSHPHYQPSAPCPVCSFRGDPGRVETLSHVNYLLSELETWQELPAAQRELLRRRYEQMRGDIEITLGLRLPPLDAEGARQARAKLAQFQALLQAVESWIERGLLEAGESRKLEEYIRERVRALQEQLVDAPFTPPLDPRHLALANSRYLLRTLESLPEAGRLRERPIYLEIASELLAEIEKREIELGLRPRPAPPAPDVRPAAPAPAPVPPRLPRQPLTWERILETLLSERTLRAMLFLGAALLFAAAVSLVVWNWEAFPPWLQVTFLALFTGIFYGLGWYVRRRMHLPDSGNAISAVASLLVPLDFYAFYLSGGFSGLHWSQVWLLASAVCLAAYLGTVYIIQAEFYGYLVGLAAGSLLASAIWSAGVDAAWEQSALIGLGLILGMLGEMLSYRQVRRWQVLAAPFWRLALVSTVTILVLALALSLARRGASEAYRTALALDWWLGGMLFSLAIRRYPLRMTGAAAAASFPIAMLLSESVAFDHWGLRLTWQASGLAVLVPLYLLAGRKLENPRSPRVYQEFKGLLLWSAAALVAVSSIWSLADPPVAAIIHPFLAAMVVLAAWLWQRPRLALFASLFLLSGTAAGIANRGATLAQLGLAWALLAILHLIAALRLGALARGRRPLPAYDTPVFTAGWIIAGLSLLPPLLAFDHGIFTYALGNWIALNGWLAILAGGVRSQAKGEHPNADGSEAPGLPAVLAWWAVWREKRARKTRQMLAPSQPFSVVQLKRFAASGFQWAAALPIPLWAWFVWTSQRPAGAPLSLVYALVAWVLLMLGSRVQRTRHEYGRPWQAVGALAAGISLLAGLVYFNQPWTAAALLLGAVFWFAAAGQLHNRWLLVAGGALFPAGWILGLDWLRLAKEAQVAALALIPVIYLAARLLDGHRHTGRVRRTVFLATLDTMAQYVAAVAFIWGLSQVIEYGDSDSALLWAAVANLLLGISFGVLSWLSGERKHAHLAAWLGVIAAALAAAVYSRGSGRSAVLAALLAVVYVLAERGLSWAARSPRLRLEWRPSLRRAWRLYRRPLLIAGWAASAGAVFLALIRNLLLLGGGPSRETWAAAATLLIAGLYAAAARLFRRQAFAPRFLWLASFLMIAPWTLLTQLGWFAWRAPSAAGYAVYWAILALAELLAGAALSARLGGAYHRWSRPPMVIAHLLLLFALLQGSQDTAVSSLSFGLALAFYLLAVWIDRRERPQATSASGSGRFLYPAAFFAPLWALYLLAHFIPRAPQTAYGALLLGFTLPALFLGRWLSRREPAYRWPLYAMACTAMLAGTLLATHDRPSLAWALLFDAAVAAISAWTFREPRWVYPAAAALPAALVLALAEWNVPANRQGWALIGLAGLYLLAARWLRGRPAGEAPVLLANSGRGVLARLGPSLPAYAVPIMVSAYTLIALGLPPSSLDRAGALVGYGAAAMICALSAIWLQRPLLVWPAIGLAAVPYWVLVVELRVPAVSYGLALWPGIFLALASAYAIDRRWGILGHEQHGLAAFPWSQPARWPFAAGVRIARWWALPLYTAAYLGAALSGLLSLADPAWLMAAMALATLVYGLAVDRFRLRGWLLAAAMAAQLTVVAFIFWRGWASAPTVWPAQLAWAFTPAAWATALAGLAVQRRLGEGASFQGSRGGWSRPLFLLLMADVLLCQATTLTLSAESEWISLSSALLLGLLATAWVDPVLAYLTPFLGLVSLYQRLVWVQPALTDWPWALALLSLGYGLAGYALRYLRSRQAPMPRRAVVWEVPLRQSGWLLSLISLLLALAFGINVVRLAVRAIFALPLLGPQDVPRVQMVTGVLAILGLFYLAAALTDRRRGLGYAAVAMLLGAWSLEWLLIWGLREVQWYAVPAGLYLLGIGTLEWKQGSRSFARWIDRAALLLLLGSSFWQSLGDNGGFYAVLMGIEGLLVLWWGSARRLRRFLYAGVAGVFIDIIGQLIEPLLSANRWIVFGVAGALLVGLAIFVERRLESVVALSQEVRSRLEQWE